MNRKVGYYVVFKFFISLCFITKTKKINTELSQTGNIITRLILVGVVEEGGWVF